MAERNTGNLAEKKPQKKSRKKKDIVTPKWGRPTKYRSHYPGIVHGYIDLEIKARRIPWVEDVCEIFKTSRETLGNWGKKHPSFFDAIKRLKTVQEKSLKIQGMTKQAAMPIFLLKSNHGYIETDRLEHTGADGEPLEVFKAYVELPPRRWLEGEVVEKHKKLKEGKGGGVRDRKKTKSEKIVVPASGTPNQSSQ